MARHKIRIAPHPEYPDGHSVQLDGQEISRAIRGISFDASASGRPDPPKAVLDLVVWDWDIESDADVSIPDKTVDLLKRLGWTPPREIPMDRREQAREWIAGFMATTDDDRVNCVALLLCAADDALECGLNHKRTEGDEHAGAV
jgi:hypothetical protein